MSPQRRNLIVGIVVLIGLGLFVWLLLLFSGSAADLFVPKGLKVTMTTDRADGISDGSSIYFRGVQVGRVTAVERAADNQNVLITADIDAKPPLPKNVEGVIRTSSALGTAAAISLELSGPPSSEPLQGGEQLQARFVGLEFFPEEITGFVGDLRRVQLAAHLNETVVSFHEQAEKAGLVLQSLQKLISDPKLEGDIHTAADNIRMATETANRIGAKLEKLSDKLDSTVDNANATMGDLRGTVSQTNAHIDTLSRQLADDVQKVGLVLDQAQQATAKVNNGNGTVGLLLNDPKLYNTLVDTSKSLSVTADSLQRLVQQWEQEGVSLKLAK